MPKPRFRIAFIDASVTEEKYPTVAIDPLALCYLAAVSKKAGHKVKIFQRIDSEEKKFLKNILEFKPNICAFSVYTAFLKDSLKLAKTLKKKTNSKIIFGGNHPTGEPHIAKNPIIDFAVIGESEQTFLELLDAIEKNKDFGKVKGIAFKKGKKIIVTKPRERIQDLDSLPLPYRKGLPRYKYKKIGILPADFKEQRIAAIITSRGCPFNCKFCLSPIMWKKQVYFRNPKKVVDEIERLIKKYKINYLRILDNDFIINKKHADSICNEIIERRIKIQWECMGSLRKVSLPLLKKMKKAGCTHIFYGIEAFKQSQLDNVKKQLKQTEIIKGLKKTDKAGLISTGAIIIGGPDETEKNLLFTAKMLKKLPTDTLEIAFVTPYPGTEFEKQIKKKNCLEKNASFDSQTPAIKTKISAKKLLQWQEKLYKEFYYSPHYQQRMQEKIKKQPELSKLYNKMFAWINKKLCPKTIEGWGARVGTISGILSIF